MGEANRYAEENVNPFPTALSQAKYKEIYKKFKSLLKDKKNSRTAITLLINSN